VEKQLLLCPPVGGIHPMEVVAVDVIAIRAQKDRTESSHGEGSALEQEVLTELIFKNLL
jgi:hypothetical protein